MKIHQRIEMNPDIMVGKPVIARTRITVEHILRKLAGGMTPEEVLKDHPHLELGDILAAQEFAADYLAESEIVFASGSRLWSSSLTSVAMPGWSRY